MRAPCGWKKHEPGDSWWKKKSSCCVPTSRWSRFFASSILCWYSARAAASCQLTLL